MQLRAYIAQLRIRQVEEREAALLTVTQVLVEAVAIERTSTLLRTRLYITRAGLRQLSWLIWRCILHELGLRGGAYLVPLSILNPYI